MQSRVTELAGCAAQFLLERRRTEFNALNKEIAPLRKVSLHACPQRSLMRRLSVQTRP